MYVPPVYKPQSPDQVRDFIEANSFAILISVHGETLVATHIPLLLRQKEKKEYLIGHVSKGNPQWKTLTEQKEILTIFSAAHSYVSSSWYDHENVPTWNYIAVHVYGKPRLIEGEELWLSLKWLIDKYEEGRENRVSMENLSERLVKKEMRGVVGFEIEISKIEAAFKLSQNRNPHDFNNVVQQLEVEKDPNAQQIAQAMKNLDR